MEHNMKLQILDFRSLLPGADNYRPGITIDRVKVLERKPRFVFGFGARLRQKKIITVHRRCVGWVCVLGLVALAVPTELH